MFGDLFNQRGDYLNGMFYRGHMKYLRDASDNSLFLPPDEFRTRRQIANLRKTQHKSTDQQQQLNFIKFQKKESEDQPEGLRRFKKAAHVVEDIIRLEHFSSTHEKDWVLRKEAGVSFWVNKNTGEVSTIKPWESHQEYQENRRGATAPGGPRSSVPRLDTEPAAQTNATNDRTAGTTASLRKASSLESVGSGARAHARHQRAWDEESHGSAGSHENPELGTGCLVYDSSEVENLFAMLDAVRK